jgi:hypothetical protein
MVVEKSFYNFSSLDLYGDEVLSRQLLIDFAIQAEDGYYPGNGSCPAEGQQAPPGYACASSNSFCVNGTSSDRYLCHCKEYYEGNPYVTNGCQGIYTKIYTDQLIWNGDNNILHMYIFKYIYILK